jgi:thiamine biosynthesis lipoprotein
MKLIITILLGVFLAAGCSRVSGGYSRTELLMGTFVQVKVSAPGHSRTELKKAVDGAMTLARVLEEKFNIYDSASEINTLNASGGGEVSPELFELIRNSGEISRITDGKFDITVAPILKANGFYKDMPLEILGRIPDSFEGVGWENVRTGADGRSILLRRGAWIDLSGIAKGYIVDRMAGFLLEEGISALMINAGGDIYCGEKNNGAPWRIGIRKPGGHAVVIALDIKDMAVATSGDYENVITDKKTGKVMAHIIDPLSEAAVQKTPSSVTVIAPTCREADALATGMMAMDSGSAVKLADAIKGVEVIVAEGCASRQEMRFSQGAAKYVAGR